MAAPSITVLKGAVLKVNQGLGAPNLSWVANFIAIRTVIFWRSIIISLSEYKIETIKVVDGFIFVLLEKTLIGTRLYHIKTTFSQLPTIKPLQNYGLVIKKLSVFGSIKSSDTD